MNNMEFMEKVRMENEAYLPELTRRSDFEAFWDTTRAIAKANPLCPISQEIASPFPGIKLFDVTYHGFDSTPIHGWMMIPRVLEGERIPCLIHYHGFTGSRGLPFDFAPWLLKGMAVLSVDCREQGGDTGNLAPYSHGHFSNVACKGILDKEEFYYRAVYMDCLKALDFALQFQEIDPERLVIEGASQGGALGMAVSALDPRPAAVMVDVPSNSNLEARVEGAHGAYASVTEYLKRFPDRLELAYETLSYFDTMNMAEWIRCPVLASVALKDTTCPAKLYYATYNRITAPKEIDVYPFNGHEGGALQMGRKFDFIVRRGIVPV